MKKLIALMLALAMVMVVVVASAGTIELQNVIDGETYTAYKILNYSESSNGSSISYYLTSDEYSDIGAILEAAGFEFTASSDGTQYYVNNAEDFDAAGAAESLRGAELGDALGKHTAVGADGAASFTDLEPGYYFVTSSAGTLCALHSDDEIAAAVEKNTVPEEDKKQSADGTDYTDDTLDFNIGDTVYYQVEITDGKGTNAAIVLTDEMSSGLTLDQNSITVKKGEAAIDSQYYTLSSSASEFTLTLKANYVATLDENEVVTVQYRATINENAAIDSDTNTNTATLTYSEQTQTDIVKLETYDILLKKVDNNHAALAGAKFNLFTQETEGTALKFSKDGTGYYLDGNGEVEIDADDGTGVNIRGLAPGTYWLEETVVPEGYNKLAARVSVEVKSGATSPAEVTVVNQAGTELPSTGGMGTTIFYVIGGLLIIGAAVVLVARRKAHD